MGKKEKWYFRLFCWIDTSKFSVMWRSWFPGLLKWCSCLKLQNIKKSTLPCMYISYGDATQNITFTVLDPRTLKHKGWAHWTPRIFLQICGSLKMWQKFVAYKEFFLIQTIMWLHMWLGFFYISKLFDTTVNFSRIS